MINRLRPQLRHPTSALIPKTLRQMSMLWKSCIEWIRVDALFDYKMILVNQIPVDELDSIMELASHMRVRANAHHSQASIIVPRKPLKLRHCNYEVPSKLLYMFCHCSNVGHYACMFVNRVTAVISAFCWIHKQISITFCWLFSFYYRHGCYYWTRVIYRYLFQLWNSSHFDIFRFCVLFWDVFIYDSFCFEVLKF